MFAASAGAAAGAFIGITEARAIHRGLASERMAVHAAAAEARREWLDYLNALLRHEVLNSVNVIEGYADLVVVDPGVDDSTRARVEKIRHQSSDLSRIIKDVRLLLTASDGDPEVEVLDLVSVVRTAIDDLQTTYGAVDVRLSAPNSARVPVGDPLNRVFSNLLNNAVKHNDRENPEVRVAVERSADAVTVRVADNGPGIPADVRDRLFERNAGGRSDHGSGLYLTKTLVDHYGGRVALSGTGPEGSVFTVELPAARTRTPESASGDHLPAVDVLP